METASNQVIEETFEINRVLDELERSLGRLAVIYTAQNIKEYNTWLERAELMGIDCNRYTKRFSELEEKARAGDWGL